MWFIRCLLVLAYFYAGWLQTGSSQKRLYPSIYNIQFLKYGFGKRWNGYYLKRLFALKLQLGHFLSDPAGDIWYCHMNDILQEYCKVLLMRGKRESKSLMCYKKPKTTGPYNTTANHIKWMRSVQKDLRTYWHGLRTEYRYALWLYRKHRKCQSEC